MGGGWVAEEALSIGLWCALKASSLEEGICWGGNHTSDSDSTGLIAGNLLGIQIGTDAIPACWLESLELREVIKQPAHDIEWIPRTYCGDYSSEATENERIWERYPGS